MPLAPELEDIVYPASDPIQSGHLKVSDLHSIYWERHGTPDAIPVMCLHGGPGSGMSSWHARLFDPRKFDIILFDQRGCGRSTPFAELEDNTTPDLISDIEQLRTHLGFESWHVFGGSWGSCLALAYADHSPNQILSLILYGIFLCRDSEIRASFEKSGPAAQLYPDYYERFLSLLTEKDRERPIENYRKLFLSKDTTVRERALREWSHWELRLMDLVPNEALFDPDNEDMDFLTTHSLFEQHYFANLGFIDGDALLARIGSKLQNKPVHMVHGRFDLVCPASTAYEAHKAIPGSTLEIVQRAGHTGKNANTMNALMKAIHSVAENA